MNVRIILRRQRGKEFKIRVREPSVSYHSYSGANELTDLWLSKHSKQFIKNIPVLEAIFVALQAVGWKLKGAVIAWWDKEVIIPHRIM